MDKTTRYLILIFICIIFFSLAPLIVIYVSGKGLSFTDSQNGTGILDVQTEPKSAQVFMDGKLTDTTPTTIRFVKQGTYTIEIKKDGYLNWSKKLFIEGGKVTYAGTLNEAIKLLPNSTAQLVSEKSVNTTLVKGNQIIFISNDNSASIYDTTSKKVVRESKLNTQVTSLTDIQDDNSVLTKTNDGLSLLNLQNLKLTTLPQIKEFQNLQLLSDNQIIFSQKNKLYSYDSETKQAPKQLMDNVIAFTNSGGLIYTLKSGANSLETYFWNGKTLVKQDVLYSGTINLGQTNKLYISSHKELFLKSDKSLYRINEQPELISDQVDYVNFNPIRQELTFTTPTEIYFYNFESGQAELFYRSSQKIVDAIVVPELGYGFITTSQEVLAVELDNRNGQNQYTLFKAAPTSLMQLTDNENQLVVLADHKLYTLLVN